MDAMRKTLRVTVVDMQPITPAVGGGRQRLMGLYHNLGRNIECTYIGSYDWPGEAYREQQLTEGLREIVVPLSSEHHDAAATLSRQTGGRTVIDMAFADQVCLSSSYLAKVRDHCVDADVVVFSHPWAYSAVSDLLNPHQLVVYDSQNVEAVLRMSLHDDLPEAEHLTTRVAELEYRICREADLVLACSQDDRETFAWVYGVQWAKLRLAPNGIFAFAQSIPTRQQRESQKLELGIAGRFLVIFIGSDYEPNNAAAEFINKHLAHALPDVTFAIIGGCCKRFSQVTLPSNLLALGTLEEHQKTLWMRAADLAVNPLTAGSGTSIKMFDFMAAGVPTITTEVGARGITYTGVPPFAITNLDNFLKSLKELILDSDKREVYSRRARQTVEDNYAWERISPALGRLLEHHSGSKQKPFFTVVIPTYERHFQLDQLMLKLDAQLAQDFEVIVIDQSSERWPKADEVHRFRMLYVHSEVKGAVSARNMGGFLATGQVIAFTDDDCEPTEDWLLNATRWFENPSVVGLEGLICSDHHNEKDWRPVSNVGFEGIGFMTANLMVRNESFQQLNGFDAAFDKPHFREDTDFGWRLQILGEVPYAADVQVFHPAQRRDIQRESEAERNRFFEKDALLLKKHPEKYRQLFFMEAHYRQTQGFWENLQRGLQLYSVQMPDWLNELCDSEPNTST